MYNPYQFSSIQPYQMPIQQVQPQMQVPSIPTATLSGRIVKSIEEIVPNEVPMNGSVAVFPCSDFSSIYVKGWNPDGTISTIQYTPVKTEQQDEQPSITLNDIMEQLTNIQDILKPKKTSAKKTTKSEADDE